MPKVLAEMPKVENQLWTLHVYFGLTQQIFSIIVPKNVLVLFNLNDKVDMLNEPVGRSNTNIY